MPAPHPPRSDPLPAVSVWNALESLRVLLLALSGRTSAFKLLPLQFLLESTIRSAVLTGFPHLLLGLVCVFNGYGPEAPASVLNKLPGRPSGFKYGLKPVKLQEAPEKPSLFHV